MEVNMIRPLKTGGCSVCKSPDDRVGKGRCQHIMDMKQTIKIEWDGEAYIGNVSIDEVDIQVNQQKIKDFIKSIEDSLTQEEKQSILEQIRRKG